MTELGLIGPSILVVAARYWCAVGHLDIKPSCVRSVKGIARIVNGISNNGERVTI